MPQKKIAMLLAVYMQQINTSTTRVKMPVVLPYMELCHALHGTSSTALHNRLLQYLQTNQTASSLPHAVQCDGVMSMAQGSADTVDRVAACCKNNEQLPVDAVAYIADMLGTSVEVVGQNHPPLLHGDFPKKQYLHARCLPDGSCGYLPFTDHHDIQHLVCNDVDVHNLLHEFHTNATADDAYGVFDKANGIVDYLRGASSHHILDVADSDVAAVLNSPLGRILKSCIISIATRGNVTDDVFYPCADGSVYCVSPDCSEQRRHSVAHALQTKCEATRRAFDKRLHDVSIAALDACRCGNTCEC